MNNVEPYYQREGDELNLDVSPKESHELKAATAKKTIKMIQRRQVAIILSLFGLLILKVIFYFTSPRDTIWKDTDPITRGDISEYILTVVFCGLYADLAICYLMLLRYQGYTKGLFRFFLRCTCGKKAK